MIAATLALGQRALAQPASAQPASAQPVDSLLAQSIEQLERGTTRGDAGLLTGARAAFERATAAESRAALAHYYVGLADYRLIDRAAGDRREHYMDDAQAHLERATELRPDWSEAHALLASVYGRKAAGGMISGIRYGRKAGRAMDRATSLAPSNPRVLLVEAISLYNKPAMFGGDKEKAVERLRDAIQQFETDSVTARSEAPGPLAPRWGHAEAYAWLGIAHMQAGRSEAARRAFEAALDVRPNYAWVTKELLPKLATQ